MLTMARRSLTACRHRQQKQSRHVGLAVNHDVEQPGVRPAAERGEEAGDLLEASISPAGSAMLAWKFSEPTLIVAKVVPPTLKASVPL